MITNISNRHARCYKAEGFADIEGTIYLSGVNLKHKKIPFLVSNIDSEILINNKLYINGLSFNIDSNSFNFNGIINTSLGNLLLNKHRLPPMQYNLY